MYDAAGNPVAGVEITAEFELGPGVESLAPDASPGARPPRPAGGDPSTTNDRSTTTNGPANPTPTPDDGTVAPEGPGSNTGAGPAADSEVGPEVGPEVGIDIASVVVSTTADDDGRFTLRGLLAGRYRLRVEGEDIFTSEVRFFDVPADGIRLVVARRVAIRGRVTDAAGQRAAGVRVGLVNEAYGQLFVTSDESGFFEFDELQEGVFQVWAARADQAAPAIRVARLGAGPFADVALALQPASIVTGRVLDAASKQGLAALVRLAASDSEEPARYVQSQPDGNFRIEGIPAGRYTAEAVAPGYVGTESFEFSVVAGPAGGVTPTLALTRGALIEGRVINHAGAPVANAVVSARVVDGRGLLQITSEYTRSQRLQRARGQVPAIAAPSGQAEAEFLPKGELGVLLGPIPFPPPAGAAALRIARALERGGSRATSDGQAGAPAPELPIHPDVTSTFVTDSTGRFRIAGLTAGRYRLLATHKDFADVVSSSLAVRLGKTRKGVVLTMRPGVLITGLVENSRKEVVVGATVIAEPLVGARKARKRAGKGSGPGGDGLGAERIDPEALIRDSLRLQAVTGTDGRYSLGPVASDVDVRVTAVRHGDVTRVVKVGKLGPIMDERTEDFVLPVADALARGRVRDPVNFPIRSARVTLERKTSSKRRAGALAGVPWRRAATTDDEGRFSVAGLPPGTYRVTVEHPGFPMHRAEVKAGPAGASGAEVDIKVPFGGGIEAEVRDKHTLSAVAGARITAAGPGGVKLETGSAEDGGVTVVPLAGGTWTLTVSAPGYVGAERKLKVPVGREPGAITVRGTRLELARGATIGGTVRDSDGVRVGGALVRVGAVTGKTDLQGSFRMRDVPTGAVEIRVEKGDRRGALALTLNPGDELVTLDVRLDPAGSPPGGGDDGDDDDSDDDDSDTDDDDSDTDDDDSDTDDDDSDTDDGDSDDGDSDDSDSDDDDEGG